MQTNRTDTGAASNVAAISLPVNAPRISAPADAVNLLAALPASAVPLVGPVAAGMLTTGAEQFLLSRDTEADLSDAELHLLTFLEGKGLSSLCWDDPEYIARAVQGGDTVVGLAQEKADFLAARRVLVMRLRAFCAAVDADDMRRAAFTPQI